jgi:hypothetical protein
VEFADFLKIVGTIQEYWIIIATLPARVMTAADEPAAARYTPRA